MDSHQKQSKLTNFKGELVGLEIEVVKSNNSSNIGIKGKVVDETLNTLSIKTKTKVKKMIKKQNEFKLVKNGKGFLIDGQLLEKRPEERL